MTSGSLLLGLNDHFGVNVPQARRSVKAQRHGSVPDVICGSVHGGASATGEEPSEPKTV